MSFVVADVITQARDILQDAAGTRWADAEIKRYIKAGQVKLIYGLPGAGQSSYRTLALAAGIEQDSAGGGVYARTLDVTWNMPLGVQGKTIRKIAKDELDAQRPFWPSEAPSATILYWMPAIDDPTKFMVYPPAITSTPVRVLTTAFPASGETVIYVQDRLLDALVYFVCARCWEKDATYAKKSMDAMQSFKEEMGFITTANQMVSENVQNRQAPR